MGIVVANNEKRCNPENPFGVVDDATGKLLGCFASRAEAIDAVATANATKGASAQGLGDGPKFHAMAAIAGVPTQDGRILKPGGGSMASLPRPLMWLDQNGPGGHQGANIFARIESAEFDEDGRVWLHGTVDLTTADAANRVKQIENGTMRFVSIDIGGRPEMTFYVDGDGNEFTEFDTWPLIACTVVPMPAFMQEAVIWMDGMPTPPEANAPLPKALQLEMVDKQSLLDALLASGAPARPPAAWFNEPNLDGLDGMLELTEAGRVYGRVFTDGQCHIGSGPGSCVGGRNPKIGPSVHGYSYAHQGKVRAADGSTVATSPLVFAPDHMTDPRASAEQAAAYYGDVGLAVADIRFGDHFDADGRFEYVWFSGAVRPDVTETQLRALYGSPVSGDWRPVDGNLELVGVMSVNRPGFPQLQITATGCEVASVIATAAPVVAAQKPGVDPHAYVASNGDGSACKTCGGMPDASVHTQDMASVVRALLAPIVDELRYLRVVTEPLREQAMQHIERSIHPD